MPARFIGCPLALGMRAVLSSACLLRAACSGAECGAEQSTSPSLVFPASKHLAALRKVGIVLRVANRCQSPLRSQNVECGVDVSRSKSISLLYVDALIALVLFVQIGL